jgi:hypothetical protein
MRADRLLSILLLLQVIAERGAGGGWSLVDGY